MVTASSLRIQQMIQNRYSFNAYTVQLHKRFALAKTGMIPRNYQIRAFFPVINSVLNRSGHSFIIEMPRQSGKSQELAETVTQLCGEIPFLFGHTFPFISNGINVGVFGPSDETSKLFTDKLSARTSSIFYNDILGISTDEKNKKHIRLSTGSHILSQTANLNAKFKEGADLDLAIVEEAQSVPELYITKVIEPMLAARNGTIVHICSAAYEEKEHGFVYYKIKEEIRRRQQGLKPDPYITIIDLEEIFNTPGTADYRRYVLKQIKKKGRDHPAIRAAFFNEWDIEQGEDYMTEEILRTCRKGPWIDSTDEPVLIVIDVAKVNDSTVIEVGRIRDRHTCFFLEMKGDDYAKQNEVIHSVITDQFPNHKDIRVDTTGNKVLADFLERPVTVAGHLYDGLDITSLTISEESRAESFMNMKLKTRRKYYTYPDVDRKEVEMFEKQTCSLKRVKKGNITRVDHQQKKGEQYHSDYPDAHRLLLDMYEEYASETDYLSKPDVIKVSDSADTDKVKGPIAKGMTEKMKHRIAKEQMEDLKYGVKFKKRERK
jgi:hypothetical protein